MLPSLYLILPLSWQDPIGFLSAAPSLSPAAGQDPTRLACAPDTACHSPQFSVSGVGLPEHATGRPDPFVGDEQGRQCGRDHTIRICGEEIPVYRRYETEYAQRERERGTKNMTIFKNATVTM